VHQLEVRHAGPLTLNICASGISKSLRKGEAALRQNDDFIPSFSRLVNFEQFVDFFGMANRRGIVDVGLGGAMIKGD
jgi:hypothetical protein